MRLMWMIFVFVLSFDQLEARSITNKRSTSSFDTSFFDNFHQLFGFYEVPPPKSDLKLGPANPSDVVPESLQPASKKSQPAPVEPHTTQPAPTEPHTTQPAPTEPHTTQPAPTEPHTTQPAPAVPQPTQPAPAEPDLSQPAPAIPQPSPSVPQPSHPLPIQPIPIVAQSKPVKSSPVAPPPVVPQPAPPVVVQPSSNSVQVPIQPLAPLPGEPVNRRNFDPVASVAQPSVQAQPAHPPVQPQPAVQPLSAQPPVHPQPVQPIVEPQAMQPQATQPSLQPPVQPQAAQPPVQPLPAQPPVQPQPLLSNPLVTAPVVNQPVQPSISGQPVQPTKPVPPALPNKPSTHQGWTGAPPRQPYYGPRQPWWRQPSPPPTIPKNMNAPHPSQQKYVSSDTAIPNKNKDIKVGIPNKTPDLRPARPLPPFHMEPSPFPLPREECITAQGELGECASYFSCGQQGGRPRGLCHLGHDVSSHARTCCVYPSFCGYQTNREVTYFKNPNYPNVTSHLGDCLYRVNLLPGVCQVRVDFMDFLMKPMKNGVCEQENSLGVTSNDENAYIPVDRMCGIMATGDHDPLKTDIAHMYVNVDDDLPVDRPRTKRYSRKTVDFKVNIQNHPARWNLRISQIQCDGANLQAPPGCAQYYNQNKGNITSFNLLDGAYPNNMDLALCIKRDPAACAIHYRIHSMGVGPAKGGAAGKTQLGYGLTCEDYLIFNGERTALCGSVSSGPKDIILPVKGEQGLTFRTDSVHIPKADTGFHIEYQYIHSCKGLEFYKYPTPGRKN